MMSDKGGIYENYDAKTGEVGWTDLVGYPSAFQFGWSSTFTMETLLDRYQRMRYLLSDETSFSGHVKEAKELATGETIYIVETGEYEVPKVEVASLDRKSLMEADEVELTFSDPYGNMASANATIKLKDLSFDAVVGHTYRVSLITGTVVDITESQKEMNGKVPGFNGFDVVVVMSVAICIGMLLKRRKSA